MSEDWSRLIHEELRRFTRDARVSRPALALALGLYDAALSRSHLGRGEAHRNRILFALGGDGLFRAAQALDLDDAGIAALKRLCTSLYRHILKHEIDFTGPRATLTEALALGEIADQQYHQNRWAVAVPRLQRAWDVLSRSPFNGSTRELALRVGNQLASWHNAQGDPGAAMRIVRSLLDSARRYRGTDAKTLREIANLYLVAAMADRHQGLASPRSLLQSLRHAEQRHRAVSGSVDGTIIALRDMAKPYLVWGLGWRGQPSDEDRLRDAQVVAHQSEVVAGGDRPLPEYREGWLFSRLNRIEVLALDPRAPRPDDPRRLWEGMMETTGVTERLALPSALRAKADFTAMALELAAGDLDALAARASSFQAAEENVGYRDRMDRAGRLVAFAHEGDLEAIRRIFLE